jgi:uncharacterized protein
MEQPDKSITGFIRKHHVLTLATVTGDIPWCANCFYSFIEEGQKLIFTSDEKTRHITEALQNPYVAASIVLETKIIGKIQGLQIEGKLIKPTHEEEKIYISNYLKRFPFAVLTNTPIWMLQIHYMKFTDNRLGFGKKLYWGKSLKNT